MVDIFHAIEVLVLCVTSRKKVLANPSAVDAHRGYVKSKEGLWALIHGKSHFSGLQSPLGITNGNRSHNKPLELI